MVGFHPGFAVKLEAVSGEHLKKRVVCLTYSSHMKDPGDRDGLTVKSIHFGDLFV